MFLLFFIVEPLRQLELHGGFHEWGPFLPTISEEESESAGTGYFGPGELTVAQKEVEKAGWDSACALGFRVKVDSDCCEQSKFSGEGAADTSSWGSKEKSSFML